MKRRPTLFLLMLALACGCNGNSTDRAQATGTSPTRSTSDTTMPTFTQIEGTQPLSEDELNAIQLKYSCELPADYRRFLLSQNGGFPSLDCLTFEESGRQTASDVFCFLACGDERAWLSLDWNYRIYSGRIPENTLPVARDSSGNLWLLCVAGESAGSVYFWDHGSYNTFDETDLDNWPLVATSFKDFWTNLSEFDAANEDNVVPSRYALIRQAVEGRATTQTGFSTRANPDFVWHCDCSKDGEVAMQFVQYKIHAAATHTCGYSRLRAQKGLIKDGDTRLPE